MGAMKLLSLVLVILTFVVGGGVLAWDSLNGESERWVRYKFEEELITYEEYPSVDACTEIAFEMEGRYGCRRIDGPFYYIGKVGDLFF